MKKKFDVNNKVNLPENIVTKRIKDYIVVLAPEYPNWIVLDEQEFLLFDILRNRSIKKALFIYQKKSRKDDEEIIILIKSILEKIEKFNFYKDAEISKEEKVEKIKKKVQINLTNDCNLRCKHCYLSAGYKELEELDFELLKDKLYRLTDIIGKTEIVFSGGEPLCYDNLINILRIAKKLGHKVILFTNGILLNNNNIEELNKIVDEIQLSMEGISKEKFEMVRGKNTYEKFKNSISLIKSKGIKLTLAITAIESTLNDIESNLISFLDKINYKNMEVRITDELEKKGNALNFPESFFEKTYNRKIRICNIIKKLADNNFNISYNEDRNIRFSNCGIGTNIIIDSDGSIYPCNEFSINFYDITDDLQKVIHNFNDLNRKTSLEYMEACHKCELKYVCCGGCRIDNYLDTGEYITPDCTEKFKNNKYLDLLIDYYLGV